MNSLLRPLILILLLIFFKPILGFGQIDLTFPSPRAVFQRNNGNAAIVYFAGNYFQKIDRIDIKCTAINGGVSLDWTPLVMNPSLGNFRGQIVLQGGWYHIDVRGSLAGQIITETSLEPVGVGEVFLISGQSNAQGYKYYGQRGASDERVSVINNFYSEGFQKPNYPTFGHLDAESDIAPTGKGAWCWGTLGDKLAARLNVPVLFMNAAWEGFDVKQFVRSLNNEAGINPYSGNSAPTGYPYQSITDALHYYANLLGIRAILWHQGESDNFLNTSSQDYVDDLYKLINGTKNSTGKELSWVIARVSKDNRRYYQPVIDAQNYVINSSDNIFAGPNTDNILNRVDGVHFSSIGLMEAAEAWNQSLDATFFQFSHPYFGNPPMYVSMECNPEIDPERPLKFTAPQGYIAYSWNNGSNDISMRAGMGFNQGMAFDRSGNVYYSAPYNYSQNIIPDKPVITASGPLSFCNDSHVELETFSTNLKYWNTGVEGNKITVNQSGLYTVTAVNFYGCGNVSNPIEVEVLPSPEPRISASGPTEICANERLELYTDTKDQFSWNVGESTSTINVTNSGEYFLTAKNEFGCTGTSNKIEVSIKPTVEKPDIINLGKSEICQEDSTFLLINNPINLKWNTGDTSNLIKVISTGGYFAQNKNEYGCTSLSEEINIKVNPKPLKPKITTSGPLIFCDDESLLLSSSEELKYLWNIGYFDQSLEITKSGEYFLNTMNEFGCLSPKSDSVEVTVLRKPQEPVLLQSGAFMLKAYLALDTNNVNFKWLYQDDTLDTNNDIIKIRKSGEYRVKAINQYNIRNQIYSCSTQFSAPYNFTINQNESGYRFYPNPIEDKAMSIETLEDLENVTITIFDFNGKTISTYYIEKFDQPKIIDFQGINAGEYIIKVKNRNNSFTGKIILE